MRNNEQEMNKKLDFYKLEDKMFQLLFWVITLLLQKSTESEEVSFARKYFLPNCCSQRLYETQRAIVFSGLKIRTCSDIARKGRMSVLVNRWSSFDLSGAMLLPQLRLNLQHNHLDNTEV